MSSGGGLRTTSTPHHTISNYIYTNIIRVNNTLTPQKHPTPLLFPSCLFYGGKKYHSPQNEYILYLYTRLEFLEDEEKNLRKNLRKKKKKNNQLVNINNISKRKDISTT